LGHLGLISSLWWKAYPQTYNLSDALVCSLDIDILAGIIAITMRSIFILTTIYPE